MTDDIAQRTAEWFAARIGHATASRIADIMAVTKSGPSAMRTNYAAELITERLTGVPTEHFSSPAMKWGTDTEPQARAAYEFQNDVAVVECGFILHPTIAWSGASPDGLVGDDGLVEIKCPNTATHLMTLEGASIDAKYIKQMQWQMACTGRHWCDFVSFDPRLPLSMQLHCRRVKRDDALIPDIEAAVAGFLADVDARVMALTAKYKEAA